MNKTYLNMNTKQPIVVIAEQTNKQANINGNGDDGIKCELHNTE